MTMERISMTDDATTLLHCAAGDVVVQFYYRIVGEILRMRC